MPCLFPFIPVMSARPFRISGATPDASSKKIPPTGTVDHEAKRHAAVTFATNMIFVTAFVGISVIFW
eukprot:m.1255111 g.1255111  ORF g.1255111 m.1255111 type:complete len:67 (+) comp24709_c0_seq40:4001-4201(+)